MDDLNTGLTLDKALRSHQQWKARLKQAVAQKEILDVHTILRDDFCDLGKWLYRDGLRSFGSNPEFSNLLAKHRDFHHTAGFVAELINSNDPESALMYLGSGSQFTFASMEVSLAITQLKAAVSAD